MKNILTIIKKELRRFFTDKRMLMGVILPGLLIFIIYSVLGGIMPSVINPEVEEIVVYVENEPEEFKPFLEVEGYEVRYDNTITSKEEGLEKIKNQELDMYVSYPEGFIESMTNYKPTDEIMPPHIEIYYNSASNSSLIIYQLYTSTLTSFESALSNKFDINNSDEVYDLATNEDMTKKIFSMLLPFILTMFLFSGAMGICADSISGEKERGTIATLLVTPVNRREIAIGKIISLGIMSLASAFFSFLGLIFSLPKLVGGEVSLNVYGIDTLLLLLLVVLVTVLLFSSILAIVSTYAKTVKEANSLSTPIMLVVTMLGMTGMFAEAVPTNPVLYLIPIYNSIQCFSGILNVSISPVCFVITIVANIIYMGLSVLLLTKMFNNEKIMFNK